MSRMVFTISAVKAWKRHRLVLRWADLEYHSAQWERCGCLSTYLDLLCDRELVVINVLHLHHEDVQRPHGFHNGGQVCIRDLRESTIPIPRIGMEKKWFNVFSGGWWFAMITCTHRTGIAWTIMKVPFLRSTLLYNCFHSKQHFRRSHITLFRG